MHTFTIDDHGEHLLVSRAAAATLRQDLEQQLRDLPAGTDLHLDFGGVNAVTGGFADELVGKFYASLTATSLTGCVLLGGLNDDTQDAISDCLRQRHLIAATASVTPRLIGGAETLHDTYTEALIMGSFRAVELAERLGITTTSVNNRLKRLTAAGALRRTQHSAPRGGKEYRYAAPDPQHRLR